jgi:tellurite resistance protein
MGIFGNIMKAASNWVENSSEEGGPKLVKDVIDKALTGFSQATKKTLGFIVKHYEPSFSSDFITSESEILSIYEGVKNRPELLEEMRMLMTNNINTAHLSVEINNAIGKQLLSAATQQIEAVKERARVRGNVSSEERAKMRRLARVQAGRGKSLLATSEEAAQLCRERAVRSLDARRDRFVREYAEIVEKFNDSNREHEVILDEVKRIKDQVGDEDEDLFSAISCAKKYVDAIEKLNDPNSEYNLILKAVNCLKDKAGEGNEEFISTLEQLDKLFPDWVHPLLSQHAVKVKTANGPKEELLRRCKKALYCNPLEKDFLELAEGLVGGKDKLVYQEIRSLLV